MIIPNSNGTGELGEVGWTAAARAAAVASRRLKMKTPPEPVRRQAAVPEPEDSGDRTAAKAPSRPRRAGERKNEQGERVIDYGDGSTVTVHADGTATHTAPDGTQRKGSYKDPQPKKPNTDPEGFSTPKPKAPKKLAALKGRKRANRPEKAARPGKLPHAQLSRTRRGPVAGSVVSNRRSRSTPITAA